MNLAYDFFQNIFQCDQSCHFAIFVKDNGDVKSRIPHFHKKFGNIFVFICEMRLAHNITNVERLCLFVIEQKIFHINNTDDIVRSIFINRKTCELIFAENGDQLFVSIIYFCECNVNAGNHNIFCVGIAEIEHVVDHLFFV